MKSVFASIIIIIILTGSYFYFQNNDSNQNGIEFAPLDFSKSESEPTPSAREVPKGAREYRSESYEFSLFYPEAMTVKEFKESSGASTVTFENIKGAQGVQIFITAYSEAQVSEARFAKDLPSGVRLDLNTIVVDGATGAAFYSRDALLGETREIWFIHDNYLFELTTLKPLENLLSEIVGTWEFVEQ